MKKISLVNAEMRRQRTRKVQQTVWEYVDTPKLLRKYGPWTNIIEAKYGLTVEYWRYRSNEMESRNLSSAPI